MKKNYILTFLSILITSLSFGQDMLITGAFDGSMSGGTPKVVEIYVINDIADLSSYGYGSANNGKGTDGQELTFEGSASAGDYIYITDGGNGGEANFTTYFGFAADYVNSSAAINGDDALELFFNDAVIDTFGNIDVDGTGTDWDYQDGWAYRNDSTEADGTTFTIANWTFSGINAVDGCSLNTSCDSVFPLGTYKAAAEASTDPMDDFEGNGNITWKADANVMNASFDNPASGGINTSAKVLEYSDEGGQYSNIQFDLSTDTSVKYDLSTKNVFTLKVYVPTPSVAVTQSKILWLKLQDGSKGGTSWQGQVVSEQAYDYDVWQELTFDFSAIASNTDMSRLVLQFNGENNNEHVKAYIDDLSYGEAATASTTDNKLLKISMYPNPASSRLTISAPKTINSAAIYNILGKQVMSLEINKNSESIDVSNLATGMYLIRYSIDNAVGTAKFIKQ